jgi:hypothetical protein
VALLSEEFCFWYDEEEGAAVVAAAMATRPGHVRPRCGSSSCLEYRFRYHGSCICGYARSFFAYFQWSFLVNVLVLLSEAESETDLLCPDCSVVLCAVLPLAAWIAAQRSCCKDAIQEPVFAPSFVAAVIATTCGTYVAILRPGSHDKLLLLLLQAAADQQQFRKLQFCNILAVKYISFFDCHACMLAENSEKLQKKRKPLLDRRKKLCLQFSLSMPCLDRIMRSHVFCLHCSSL